MRAKPDHPPQFPLFPWFPALPMHPVHLLLISYVNTFSFPIFRYSALLQIRNCAKSYEANSLNATVTNSVLKKKLRLFGEKILNCLITMAEALAVESERGRCRWGHVRVRRVGVWPDPRKAREGDRLVAQHRLRLRRRLCATSCAAGCAAGCPACRTDRWTASGEASCTARGTASCRATFIAEADCAGVLKAESRN